MEKDFNTRKEELERKYTISQDSLNEQRQMTDKYLKALNTLESRDPSSIEKRLIELTK